MWNFDNDGNENINFKEFTEGLSRIGITREGDQLNALVYTLEKEQMAQAANPLLYEKSKFRLRTVNWRSAADDSAETFECSLEILDVTSHARNGLRCSSGVRIQLGPAAKNASRQLTVDNLKSICTMSSSDEAVLQTKSHRALQGFDSLHFLEPLDCFGNFPV